MVALGLDVIALMGRVAKAGRVERTLQAVALLDGLNERWEYRLKYLYRASGEDLALSLERAFTNLEDQS